ncbi:kinase-like protein [Microthyrium microscopicum]|uniref:Kinase-like protein n=1 Tax=Microthyrium microscopicum TaxID=703497 RepID=A0A6A6U718_9PEZI|nr:kinase-like protein [Microthyrium microscopicum]
MLFEPSATVKIGFGGYSTVYKEIIPAGQFRYKAVSESATRLNDAPLPVARKYFPYKPDFDRELEFLSTITSAPNQGHERIVQYLAVVIYTQTSLPPTVGKYNLLFPLANCDLAQSFNTEDFSRFELKHLIRELFHLADALVYLHTSIKTSLGASLISSHMDLNPRNILIFRSDADNSPAGTWKITDFSTSTLMDENGHDILSLPKLVPESYMAPEIQTPIGKNKADPACDIWSFGCIVFEVLLAHVEGVECRSWKDKFGNPRCYYERKGNALSVESRAWEWLNSDVGDEFMRMGKRVVMDMLTIEPRGRPTAEQVRDRLEMLLE